MGRASRGDGQKIYVEWKLEYMITILTAFRCNSNWCHCHVEYMVYKLLKLKLHCLFSKSLLHFSRTSLPFWKQLWLLETGEQWCTNYRSIFMLLYLWLFHKQVLRSSRHRSIIASYRENVARNTRRLIQLHTYRWLLIFWMHCKASTFVLYVTKDQPRLLICVSAV